MYLLDTNTFTLALRGNENVQRRLLAIPRNDVFLSGIVVREVLMDGWFRERERIETGKSKQSRAFVFESLFAAMNDLLVFPLLPYTDEAEAKYRAIFKKSAQVDVNDWRIAAHAFVTDKIVVTDNTGDFERIAAFAPELQFENWAREAS
jgi:predicted nucleic acid-binding protein